MKNIDSHAHLRGESQYLDDLPLQQGTLHGWVFDSPIAHGEIRQLHLEEALRSEGVVRIFTHRDIPGENQIGGIVRDEVLLAEDSVHCCGMPIAFVVATSEEAARKGARKIRVDIDPLPVITDPREAAANGELIVPPRTFAIGNVDEAWKECAHIFEGRADVNGQEHLYIETQGAYAFPTEKEGIRIVSSTQGPTAVQRHCANVLGIPMHRIEVDVTRLGGGFGGKEDQATPWAILCALATYHLRRPVKLALHRMDDMRMTGKRHPYSSDFRIGLSAEGKILAYEATHYQNAGCSADLSPAVLERTLFHSTNTYFIPNTRVTAFSCRTHLPSNTAFRGFGGPQGMFVVEAAIHHAAERLGMPASEIQKRNLLQTGDELPYGQRVNSEAVACWQKAEEEFSLTALQGEVTAFNQEHLLVKKGLAVMPICFGISFTKIMMNQARALVHVYQDGSVSVSTGAVEMGQGVNTKMLQVAAAVLSVHPSRVTVHSTSTFRIANTSPSAASATTDLNGKATQLACTAILERLKEVAAEAFGCDPQAISLRNEEVYIREERSAWDWRQLVMAAYVKRVALSEHAHYATPDIHFDNTEEKGHPFAYHVFGTAITTVTVDCLRGTYDVDAVRIVHDFGTSMNPLIDRGQIEGGLVQGIGWMTLEEVVYDAEGRLRSNALSTYKVPDIYSVPKLVDVRFLETDKENLALFHSKAVGEPPLMYGIGAYFALRNAVRAFHPGADLPYSAPMTPEKVLTGLYSGTQAKA